MYKKSSKVLMETTGGKSVRGVTQEKKLRDVLQEREVASFNEF